MGAFSIKSEGGNYQITTNQCRISMQDLLKVFVGAIMVLSVTITGCSSDGSVVEGVGGNLAIIDEWVSAVNSEDVSRFEQLHTEDVTYHSNRLNDPSAGRQNMWESLQFSTAGPIEKIYAFGQEDMMCLQVTSMKTSRSLLFVFYFEGEQISQVFEYSGDFDLTETPLFDGVKITTDNTDLPERINTIESQTEAHNNRDYLSFINTFNEDAILYVPPSNNPVLGTEDILKDVQSFTENYPAVELVIYRTFGQGNLVCQQIAVKNGPMGSLGFVNVFEEGKVSRAYEYFSRSELID